MFVALDGTLLSGGAAAVVGESESVCGVPVGAWYVYNDNVIVTTPSYSTNTHTTHVRRTITPLSINTQCQCHAVHERVRLPPRRLSDCVLPVVLVFYGVASECSCDCVYSFSGLCLSIFPGLRARLRTSIERYSWDCV